MNAFPAANLLVQIVFAIALLLTATGALIAVLTKRIIRSVCGLALCCCGLAGLYYYLQSPFLSLMEILIYIGAICVTIIFAVMLAEPDEAPNAETSAGKLLWGGSALVASGVVFWGVSHLGLSHSWPAAAPVKVNQGTIQDLGMSLLTT